MTLVTDLLKLTRMQNPTGAMVLHLKDPATQKDHWVLISDILTGQSYDSWQAGTTYATGERVTYGFRLFESLQNANTGHIPSGGAGDTWWKEVSESSKPDKLERVIALTAHGFNAMEVLTVDNSGDFVLVSDPDEEKFIGIVTEVIDANNFKVVLAGYVTGLSGLTPGSVYYSQADGTLGTAETNMQVLLADTATSGYILSSGGSGASTLEETLTEGNDANGLDILDLGSLQLRSNEVIDVVASGGSDILNIGTSNADVINIGWSGAQVNIQGTVLYQNVTNLEVADKLIRLNRGGAGASGVSSGFEIEEGGVVAGYFATNASRDGFDIKAPAITHVASIELTSLSASRTYTLPNESGELTVDGWKLLNGGTLIGNNDVSGDGSYGIGFSSLSYFTVETDTDSGIATTGGGALTFTSSDGGDYVAIDLDYSGGITVTMTDVQQFKEAADYSANYGPRSYITKGYADATYAGGGAWLLAGGGTLTGPNVVVGTTTNTIAYRFNALGTSTTYADGTGLRLTNDTAAAAGSQQFSPALVLEGKGWGTSAAASQAVKYRFFLETVQNTQATGIFHFQYWNGTSSSYTDALTYSTAPGTQTFTVVGAALTVTGGTITATAGGVSALYTTGLLLSAGVVAIKATGAGSDIVEFSASYNLQYNITLNKSTHAGSIRKHHRFLGSYVDSAANSSFASHVELNPTYNLTGSNTSSVAGVYYNPTVTSVMNEHYAWRHDSGFVSWNSVLSPAQLTSNQNDYNPTGWRNGGAPNGASIMRLNSDASRDITSLQGGVSGRLAILANVGSQDIVLKDDDGATGTAANRFALNGDITLQSDEAVLAFYDATSSRWRVIKN